MLKHTPLFDVHRALNARLIDFGGWEMPVQYTSIIEEHHAVRSAAGIFDISHMGEFMASGPGARDFLNHALTNDAARLASGKGQYTLMCNETGGVVDDLYLYCLAPERYLLVVNASRIDVDWAHLTALEKRFAKPAAVCLENQSALLGAVAIQGPRVADFIDSALGLGSSTPALRSIQKNEIRTVPFGGEVVHAARTGYTGEDGFEVIAPAALIEQVWTRCFEHGSASGLKPCGLGARDTLRMEACYPLYGHELDETTTPLEAGLGVFVALDKGEFVGRSALLAQKRNGVSRKLCAFKMEGKAPPPRQDYVVWSAGPEARPIGRVTSGTQSPTLGAGIGLGYLDAAFSQPDTSIQIEIRGNRFPARIVKKPFYRRKESN